MSKETVLLTARPSMVRTRPFAFSLNLVCIFVALFCLANKAPVGLFVAAFVVLFIGLLKMAQWWIETLTTSLVVTSTQVTRHKGLLARDFIQMRHVNIQNTYVQQGILQRLMKVGSVGLSSSGQGDVEIIVHGIPNPKQVSDQIQEILHNQVPNQAV